MKKGFTLVEVMIALVITVGAALLVSNAWSGNLLRVRKSNLLSNVTVLLERKIIEMEAKYQGKPINDIKEEEGNFGTDYPLYRWSFGVQPFVMPDLTALLSQSDDSSKEMVIQMLAKMRELLSKTVLEGKVTVYVKVGEKEMQYSVTTYFVDFNAPELETGVSL